MANGYVPEWLLPPPVAPELQGAQGVPQWWEIPPEPPPPPEPVPPASVPPPVAPELQGGPGVAPPDVAPPPRTMTMSTVPDWVADKMQPDAISGAGEPVATAKPSGPFDDAVQPPPQGKNAPSPDYTPSWQDEQEASIIRMGEIEEKKARLNQERLQREADYGRAQQQDVEMQEMERRRDLHQRFGILEAERQAIANTNIDTQRFIRSNESSMAMLGAISGLTGDKQFIDQANLAVQRDIDAQKVALANRQEALGQGRSLYSQLLQTYQDERTADQMMRAIGFEQFAREAAAQGAQFDSMVVQENTRRAVMASQAAAMQATQQAAQAQQDAARKREIEDRNYALAKSDNARQWASTNETRRHNMAEEGRVPAPTLREQVMLSKEQREIEQDRAGRLVHLGRRKDGAPLIGPTPTVTAEVNNALAIVQTTTQKLDRLHAIYDKNGWTPMGRWGSDGEDHKEATAIFEELLADFSVMKEQGVIRDGEYKRYERMFGAPGGFHDPRTNLKAAKHSAIQGANNKLRARIDKDAAYWDPAPEQVGNDGTATTNPEASKRKQRAAAEQDRAAPRPGWEVVEQSPDGRVSITADNVAIPAGRSIVGETLVRKSDGRSYTTYELDDGTKFDVEED